MESNGETAWQNQSVKQPVIPNFVNYSRYLKYLQKPAMDQQVKGLSGSAGTVFEKGGKVWLRVVIKPQSRREGVLGIYGESVKIGVKAPPVEGRANEALIQLLASLFGCSRGALTLEQGAGSRNKLVSFADLDKNCVLSILEKLLMDA